MQGHIRIHKWRLVCTLETLHLFSHETPGRSNLFEADTRSGIVVSWCPFSILERVEVMYDCTGCYTKQPVRHHSIYCARQGDSEEPNYASFAIRFADSD